MDKNENPYVDNDMIRERVELLPKEARQLFMGPYPKGLTATQMFAIPVLKWMIYGQIAGGKTTALAHAIIQAAIECPKRKFWAVDHVIFRGGDSAYARRLMFEKIQDVWKEHYSDFICHFNQANQTIEFTGLTRKNDEQ
jgi:hypothetical protein